MCKWCLAVCLLVSAAGVAAPQNRKLEERKIRNPGVAYAPAGKLRRYPFPVVNFEREGLARPGDQKEIMEGIIYPVINKSKRPVAAMIVTFYPEEPHITVLVLWHGEQFRGVLIERNAAGHFDADAYKVFLEEVGT
jgi:hypothetical protein